MSERSFLFSDLARWGVVQADTLKLLPLLPSGSVDAVVVDPPYGIDMGGMAWDGKQMRTLTKARTTGISNGEAFEHFTYLWAVEVLRILKPGGFMLAFGATRTFHRLTTAVEDTGLEIRDVLMWLYSSGVPKSRRYPDGMGAALKPAYEPILMARKPPEGALQANMDRYGTGLLGTEAASVLESTRKGPVWRWPANVTLTHHPDCDLLKCADGCPVRVIGETSTGVPVDRVFYTTKAQPKEREAGLGNLPKRKLQILRSNGKVRPRANIHQTVKPLDLMRWLVRLACPPGGLVLDPFTGSGSTGIAAVMEGRQFLGIEREPEYVRIAHHRIRHWAGVGEQGSFTDCAADAVQQNSSSLGPDERLAHQQGKEGSGKGVQP